MSDLSGPIHSARTHRLTRVQTLVLVATGLACALVVAIASTVDDGPLSRLDHAVLDGYLKVSARGEPARGTVVVDIDDVSLSAVGQWPWPRYRIASMIERIAAHQPAAIGLDILFPEPDRSSLNNIQETFKRDFGVDVAFGNVPTGLLDNDGFLGHAIGSADVVGSHYLYFDHYNKGPVTSRSGLSFDGDLAALKLNAATGVLANADEIARRTRTSGFVNHRPDADGTLRRLPLLIAFDRTIHANLALATVMRALGVVTGHIDVDADGAVLRIGRHRIPLADDGSTPLRMRGDASSYPALSAIDLITGNFDDAAIRGKVVFVGSSAVGLNDLQNTSMDPRFPGLKVQAAMAQDILDDDFVRTPAWAGVATLTACLIAAVLMALLFTISGSAPGIVAGSVVLTATTLTASALPFLRDGVFVSPAAPLVVVAASFVLFFVARFVIEKRRARVWLRQLENARQVTIESMASVAETRDPETGAHIKRTQHYVRAIAEALLRAGHHVDTLTKPYIDLLFLSAPLHDIGKVGVPDHILLKPARLTAAEFEVMKQHPEFGRRIILSSSRNIDGDNFLVVAGEIAASHHEKWDGTGYPLGLAGEAIPLSGRIMAAADIYDALISRRCYKEPFPHALAMTMMREQRGTTFDPVVLDAFLSIETTIREIAARYGDESEVHAPAPAPRPSLVEGLVTS